MRKFLQRMTFAVLGLAFAGAGLAHAQKTITCASDDGKRHTCHVDARGGVQMVNQRSGSACQQNYSWGTSPEGIWVDHGCRADFQTGGGNGMPGTRPFGMEQTLTCSSDNGGRRTCPAIVRSGVTMIKQRSDKRCQQGYSWGYDQTGVWVDHGCRADFAVR